VSSRLARAIDSAARLLPAQGPITVFIHHNTLHSLERMPFEQAAVTGGELFGCEAFLPEEQYRLELRRGRIREADLRAVLHQDLGPAAGRSLHGFSGLAALRLAWLRHGIPAARGEALAWLLSETDALEVARPDLDAQPRQRLLGAATQPGTQAEAVRALWTACRAAVSRHPVAPNGGPRPPVRHRDLLLATLGEDPDALVHPLLIRLCAAYLDQGVAAWPMPDRDLGFFRCVLRLYGVACGSPAAWMRATRRLLVAEAASGRSALASIESSLVDLGVPPDGWEEYLIATSLALRGWAGMMRQMEVRPDRVPVGSVPASLTDFLAVRLLLDRAAASAVLRGGPDADLTLAQLRERLAGRLPAPMPPAAAERAWPLFHLAQILGKNARDIEAMGEERIGLVLREIDAFDEPTRRRLLHLAYERRLRHQFYDAVATHAAADSGRARFQAVFCIDEREESIRRHLEETAPACETFGTAGFFGVAMYYRGADESHARPLCPVAIRPEHEIEEIRTRPRTGSRARGHMRRAWGRIGLELALGSGTLVRGTIATAILGALAAIPLMFRVFSPRLASRMLHHGRSLVQEAGRSELALLRREDPPSQGRFAGFAIEEMGAIVRRVLQDAGLTSPAPLVLIVGHGSTSLNNPHESAHDCGACGGGRGGPNARAFAQMANDPEVRRSLAAAGVRIPAGTWFVGAEHNTASDGMEYFDLERTPVEFVPRLREAMSAMEEARRRNAHERCRRFRAAPLSASQEFCLLHVETRAEDLAQTRPEYGHATNAFCVVGRRRRTRGLFLDRRAFLVSYDPAGDDAHGTILARVLAGVVPVVAGISLEYYFAYVDQTGYGCGTKLPHNVAALLGVMDGHSSDLRTGLPRQMVEIHEPVRLTLLVETPAATLVALMKEDRDLDRLVSNGWIRLAALDPDAQVIHDISGGAQERYRVESPVAGEARSSAEWYSGRRDFLAFARILVPAGQSRAR